MSKYRLDEEQWGGNSEEDDKKERTKIDPEEFKRLQEELSKKIKKHVEESNASEDLVNPEFL